MYTPDKGDQSGRKNIQAKPEFSTHMENMDAYDTVLVGYPNWLSYYNLIRKNIDTTSEIIYNTIADITSEQKASRRIRI